MRPLVRESPANSADGHDSFSRGVKKQKAGRNFLPAFCFFDGVTGNPSFLSVGVRWTGSDLRALSDLANRVVCPWFPFSGGITRLADEKNDFAVILVTPGTIAP
jgi:hypothetical protein